MRDYVRWIKQLIHEGKLQRFYTSTEWRKAREKALKYYNYECQICRSKTPSKLTPATMVHHVKPVKLYPQYALSLFIYDEKTGKNEAQLIPLCHECHEIIEGRCKSIDVRYPERW